MFSSPSRMSSPSSYTQKNTQNNNYQLSGSQRISCWPAATAAQYQVYVLEQSHTAARWTFASWRNSLRFEPPFFSTVQEWAHVCEGSREKSHDCCGSRRWSGRLLISHLWNSKFRVKMIIVLSVLREKKKLWQLMCWVKSTSFRSSKYYNSCYNNLQHQTWIITPEHLNRK